MLAPSCCPAVLKATRQQNVEATSGRARKLRCQWGWQRRRDLSWGVMGPPTMAASSVAQPKEMPGF